MLREEELGKDVEGGRNWGRGKILREVEFGEEEGF